MRAILGILVCSVCLLPCSAYGAGQGFVASGHSHAEGQGAAQEQIIESVQKRYNARVLRVTETTVDGRPALSLRLLSAQRVWNMVVDARTGRVLSGG